MLNRLLFLVIVIGLSLAAWSSWKMYASTGGVIQDKEKTQSISEDWNKTEVEKTEVEELKNKLEIKEKADEVETEKIVNKKKTAFEKEYKYAKGDRAGELIVPKLERIYEVYWGTDNDTLNQGVGYHDSRFTTPPDGMRHTVLSGHRDTVFSELGLLEDGDRVYMKFEGNVYEYQIRKIWITDAEDRTVIVDKEIPTLTLTTCYPFNFLGAAPDRYIIQGELISVKAE